MTEEKYTHRKSGKLFIAVTSEEEGYYSLTGEDGKTKRIAEKTLKKGYRKWQEEDGEINIPSAPATPKATATPAVPATPPATSTKEDNFSFWLHESGTVFVTDDSKPHPIEVISSTPITNKEYNEAMGNAEMNSMEESAIIEDTTSTPIEDIPTPPPAPVEDIPTLSFWKQKETGEVFEIDWIPDEEEMALITEISKEEYLSTMASLQGNEKMLEDVPLNRYWDMLDREYWSMGKGKDSNRLERSYQVSEEVFIAGTTMVIVVDGKAHNPMPILIDSNGTLAEPDEVVYMYHIGSKSYSSVVAELADNYKETAESIKVTELLYNTAVGNKIPVIELTPLVPLASSLPENAPSAEEAVDVATEVLEPEDTPEKPTENSMRANREAKLVPARPFVPARPYLRQSMIKTYELDPGMFYRSYEDNIQDNNIFSTTGTSVHGVMEDFFTLVKEGKVYVDPTRTGEATIEWKGKPYNIKQFVKNRMEEWWGIYGWANLEWYKLFLGYTEQYLIQTVMRGLPEVIAVELEFTLESDKLGTPVTGTIDRVDRINETTIRIVDYKTNFMAFTASEVNESQQFMMYTLALRELKDQVGEFDTCICQYDMIRLGISQSVTFNDSDLEDFKSYMAMLWAKMLAGQERDFKPNKFTAFSSMRDDNPAYNEMLHDRIVSEYKAGDLKGLIEELDIAKATEKTAKVRKDELNLALKSHIAQADGLLNYEGYNYKMSSAQTVSYDSKEVVRTLAMFGSADLIPDIVSFSDKALRDNLPAPIHTQLKENAHIAYANPTVTRSKEKITKPKK